MNVDELAEEYNMSIVDVVRLLTQVEIIIAKQENRKPKLTLRYVGGK